MMASSYLPYYYIIIPSSYPPHNPVCFGDAFLFILGYNHPAELDVLHSFILLTHLSVSR